MNVILIVCDTWRRDHSGAYGNDWIHTPNIDKLAARGTVFDNYYCSSFPTLPNRRDVATGRYEFPWRGWGGLEMDDVPLGGLIRDAGQISYFISDVYHHWTKSAGNYYLDFSGFELIRGQERDNWIADADLVPDVPAPPYATPDCNIGPHLRNVKYLRHNEEDWFSPQVFSRATRWIEHNASHPNFFLMLDSFDPHEPWDPPRYYSELYNPGYEGDEYVAPAYRAIDGYLTDAEFKQVQALYAGEITMLDRWLGYFLDTVERMGLLDETMIVLTTDHGTYNGDHGQVGKLQRHMLQGISHLPLIIWHPEFGHGQRVPGLAQTVDLFPTILEAAGVAVPEGIHGRSLMPLLKGDTTSVRDHALSGRFCFAANLTDGEFTLYQPPLPDNLPLYSYSYGLPKWNSNDWGPYENGRRLVGQNANTGGREHNGIELYHLPTDPGEEHNLAEEQPEELRRMQGLLRQELKNLSAPAELLVRLGLEKS